MPVIAVVNRKGGSGKSTVAAHLAAWCAQRGHAVMLGDVDRQQSSRGWLRRRPAGLPAIAPWAMDQKNVLRLPSGISHVVLDTPGGLHGFELARIVMFADAILVPVCPSVFDRESAAACHAELMNLPRVASGRCRIAAVGMRVDGRTSADALLRSWAEGVGIAFLGSLRETQLYVRTLERGLTVFDLPARQAAIDLPQWQPVLDWLSPLVEHQAANDGGPSQAGASSVRGARPARLMPAQDSLVAGTRLSVLSGGRPLHPKPDAAAGRPPASATAAALIPRFLKA